jgi:hypothetical protein
MNCLVDPEGVRRFKPSVQPDQFILQAALAGSVMLKWYEDHSPEQQYDYHEMRLIYQLGRRVGEYYKRSFKTIRDLHLPKAASVDHNHVLPPHLGFTEDGSGQPWTPATLIPEGCAFAIDTGVQNPSPEICIRFGLLMAARRLPFKIESPEECLRLVRFGLFDLGPNAEHVTESDFGRVHSRLRHAIRGHLKDHGNKFYRWLITNYDGVIHRIAKQKRSGGPIPNAIVRSVILELVFRAYTYIGRCVNVFMRNLLHCLPEPLTPVERPLFDSFYLGQPALGGLPVILLRDRLKEIREPFLEILANPENTREWGVALRLLDYYGNMASAKRTADRRYKNQRHHRNDLGRSAISQALDSSQPAPEIEDGLLQAVAAEAREARRAACSCETLADWYAEWTSDGGDSTHVMWRDTCSTCKHFEDVSVTRTRFQKISDMLSGLSD